MNEISDLYASFPFMGYRRITEMLNRSGYSINRKRILRLMGIMGLAAVFPKMNLSKRRQQDMVFPYLLHQYPALKVNDVWGVDITYIKLQSGFVYLVALIDVVSRRIMGWSLSPFLETTNCLEAFAMAASTAIPKIMNSDQGCQFTSRLWVWKMVEYRIEISMDSKGRCLDNIYIERFWRSLKYEEVYLKAYETVNEARREIGAYIEFYNNIRPHQSLLYQTPQEIYLAGVEIKPVDSVDNSCALPTLPTGKTTSKSEILNIRKECASSSKLVA
jgi:putative transposase